MNTKGNNRSVIRTQTMLKNGLTELMLKKPVRQISVKELTAYVNLNRGTFYLHYRDIFDLLEHIENEMLEYFQDILESHQAEELKGKPFPLLKDIFQFLGENADFCRAILGENKDWNFIDKLKTILKEKCFYDWEYLFAKADPEIYEIYYSFVLSGCIGIIENWLFSDMKQSAEEIATITENIILHGILVLKAYGYN